MAEYNKLTPELLAELESIVGTETFSAGDDVNEDYSHDEMPIYGSQMPEDVVLPNNTHEVSAIMKLCNENNIPVTVRGAGTGLCGGSTPLHGGVVLCTMNMNQILSYDMNNLCVTIQPGVRLCDLQDALPKKLTNTLEQAMPRLAGLLPGFDAPDALLTAPETRSSSPVRIVRGEDCQSELRGLYPCGEGAGYAGGILSAAVDGMRCAEAVLSRMEDKT